MDYNYCTKSSFIILISVFVLSCIVLYILKPSFIVKKDEEVKENKNKTKKIITYSTIFSLVITLLYISYYCCMKGGKEESGKEIVENIIKKSDKDIKDT